MGIVGSTPAEATKDRKEESKQMILAFISSFIRILNLVLKANRILTSSQIGRLLSANFGRMLDSLNQTQLTNLNNFFKQASQMIESRLTKPIETINNVSQVVGTSLKDAAINKITAKMAKTLNESLPANVEATSEAVAAINKIDYPKMFEQLTSVVKDAGRKLQGDLKKIKDGKVADLVDRIMSSPDDIASIIKEYSPFKGKKNDEFVRVVGSQNWSALSQVLVDFESIFAFLRAHGIPFSDRDKRAIFGKLFGIKLTTGEQLKRLRGKSLVKGGTVFGKILEAYARAGKDKGRQEAINRLTSLILNQLEERGIFGETKKDLQIQQQLLDLFGVNDEPLDQ